ncbi:hypothetical protein [Cloacibacterium rupense]|nr:hypothetical protein [Cloacibacterium rupense]
MKRSNNDFLILLTCCVNPKDMVYTKINDPKIRIEQYYKAFDYYLFCTPYKILIVENTLFDIDTKYKQNERIEYLTFDGNNFDKSLGKGYGEALIIKYAIENSNYIKENKNINIIKITGRLIVLNINKHIQQFNDKYRQNQVLIDTNLRFDIVYSYFFIANFYFFTKYFLKNKEMINDSLKIYFEHVLLLSVKEYIDQGNFYDFFKRPIIIDGVSGSTGEKYTDGSQFKLIARHFLKRFLLKFKNNKPVR